MASWLSTLSRSARAIYPIARRGAREGLSIESIGKAARAAGFRIANDSLREMVHRVREMDTRGRPSPFESPTRVPSAGMFAEAVSKIRKQYSYTVEIRGLSEGEEVIRHFTIASNERLPNADAIEAARGMLDSSSHYVSDDFEESGAFVVGRLKAGPAGRF